MPIEVRPLDRRGENFAICDVCGERNDARTAVQAVLTGAHDPLDAQTIHLCSSHARELSSGILAALGHGAEEMKRHD